MSDPTLQTLGLTPEPAGCYIGRTSHDTSGPALAIHSPIDGQILATVRGAQVADVEKAIAAASKSFLQWRTVPAPRRGELVRHIADRARTAKQDLARLISLENGKILQESLGEVQEMIDMADFAVGLSRQLPGQTLPSERPGHRMMEQWHPLGPVGVITAFNFPIAVFAWNAMLALVCGDTLIWKPSEKTPLCAIALHKLIAEAIAEFPDFPDTLVNLVIGGADVGQSLASSRSVPLISATGSVKMGQAVATTVAQRLGRSLLELGGNNAMIVTPSADLDLATRAIVFSAVGTAGQRCTTLRRLIVHNSIKPALIARLKSIYARLPIGNPLDEKTLVGPLIDRFAFDNMQRALKLAQEQGATLIIGGQRTLPDLGSGAEPADQIENRKSKIENPYYVHPALLDIPPAAPIIQEETFAPILYIMGYETLDEAIAIHNNVPQGLSSAIFTNDLREAEIFLSPAGSDCGIANVNIGTSGAEIGGAFGGEKATGGGRESGSDAWKAYMRRATNTINYSRELPLAQGIQFDTVRS